MEKLLIQQVIFVVNSNRETLYLFGTLYNLANSLFSSTE